MQITYGNLLRVIFVLSTIVIATDCCSSRILLLREHTLKIVHDHGFFNNNNNNKNNDSENHHKHLHHRHRYHEDATQSEVEDNQPKNRTEIPEWGVTFGTPVGELLNEAPLGSSTEDPDDAISSTQAYDGGGGAMGELPTGMETEPSSSPIPQIPYINLGTLTPQHKIDLDFMTLWRDFMWLKCDGQYSTDFCLNRGRCFRFPLGNHSLYSCECADGYVGERCESKNGQFLVSPSLDAKPKILMARIVFSFPMLIALSALYIACGAVIVFKSPQNCMANKRRAAGMLAG